MKRQRSYNKVSKRQRLQKLRPKSNKSAPPSDGKLRLFVDPASISSGWALFRGTTLVESGTFLAEKKANVFERLRQVHAAYKQLGLSLGFVDEVHIECMPRRVHIYTMWSVGCIGAALYPFAEEVKDDLHVKSWQKHADWKNCKEDWVDKYSSEDEFAAICMGKWFLSKRTESE